MASRLLALSPTPPLLRAISSDIHRCGNGPNNPDVPPASGIDPERLDGLPARAAGEGPRGVRPPAEQVAAALERCELLRPPRPEHPGDPLDPPGDGTGHRGAETGTFFGRRRF